MPEADRPEKRLSFGKFVDKAFWAMIIIIAASIADKASRIDRNTAELNRNFAIVAEKLEAQSRRVDDADARIHDEESRIGALERLHFVRSN